MALSLAFLLVSTDLGRGLLVPRLVGLANRELAGRIELKGFHLLTEGGVELVGLRVIDPEGEVVLALDRARIYADLKRIRSRSVGLRLALEGPDVLLQPDLEGRLSLVRALSPRHPSPPSRPHPFAWTVRVSELSFTGGHVHYRAQHPAEELEATALDLKGRGAYGPRGGRVELTLRGRLMKPQEAPLALDLAGSLLGSRVRVRLLRAAVGDTAVDLLGDGDLATRRGRVALLALAVDARQVQALVPGSPLGGDLAGTVYAESDGKRATLALDLAPRGQGGRARGAAALRLSPGALAAGAELHLEALDLSRVLRGAPASALTLDALGRAAGEDLSSLVGTLTLSLARSRLRGVELGPAELRASAQRGEFEVARLEAHLPGGSVEGAGRFRLKGELAGDAHVEASDVGALRRALERLLGEPLPPLEGALRLEAHLTGSEASPSAALTLVAPRLEGAGVAARGLSLRARLSGPLRSLKAALDGEAAEVTHGGFAARALRLRGELAERSGEIHVTANIPALGPEVLEVGGRGALSPDRQQLSLSELELTFSGARFELEAPCTVSLAGPRVDRLALRSGSQAIALSGGIAGEGRRRTLAARATLTALDLALVPRAFLPAGLGLAGRLSADLTAEGALGAPSVSGRVELSEGAVLGIEGLSAHGDLGWLGPAERARFDLEVTRKGGGELAVKGELPGRLARAPRGAPLSLVLAARHLAVAEALRLARVTPPAALEGDASLELALGGTAGEPTVDLKAALEDGRYGEFEALAASLHLLYQAGKARLTAALDRAGARAVDLALSAPLDLAALLRDPERVARGLSGEPMSGVVDVKDQDLAAFSGRLGLPEGLQGRVTARLGLSGSPRAPRGELDASLEDGAVAGYSGLSAKATLVAQEGATRLVVRTALGGAELARFSGEIALSPEALSDPAARAAAAIEARLEVPRADLGQTGVGVPLAGEISGTATFEGSLKAPRLAAEFRGEKVVVSGHPLGAMTARAKGAGHTLEASLHFAVDSGGTLDGTLVVQANPSLPALRERDLWNAPARATLVARGLDLRVLPAALPGLIRSASGTFEANLTAEGTLAHLLPRGEAKVSGGELSVIEVGELSAVEAQITLAGDVARIERLSARRGAGSLELEGELKGLDRRGTPADLKAELRTSGLDLPHAGQTVATLDLDAKVTGKLSPEALEAEVAIASARVKLPDLNPRRVQSLQVRKDIVVAPFSAPEPGTTSRPEKPFRMKLHLVAPARFLVKSDNPFIDLELRADLTAELGEKGGLLLGGEIRVVRGRIEPVSGRSFDLNQGRIEFPGKGYEAGALELKAVYDNTAEKVVVTVAVSGTLEKPEVTLTSQPSLTESQIAMLIATGHKELRADTGGVGAGLFDAQSSQTAAVGTLSTLFVQNVVGQKLPVDMVSVDPSQLRAGKYVSDKLYVGYTRRLNALTEEGENTNEVEADYQIAPQLTFEVRYGDTGSGGASLIWSKDY